MLSTKTTLLFALISILFLNSTNGQKWWENHYFYELNVRSFKDSDGDGIGDFQGIVREIGHLKSLGVGSVILSTILQQHESCSSPGIIDLHEPDPDYGTAQNFQELIKTCDESGIKVILDLSLNAMSVESEWFVSSDSTELFVWRTSVNNDTEDDSVWRWDESRKKHFKLQGNRYPVLNLENRRLYDQLQKVLQTWMDRGVAGFRIDCDPDQDYEGFSYLKKYADYYSRQRGGYTRVIIGDFDGNARDVFSGNNHISALDSFHIIFTDSFIYGLGEHYTAKDIKFIIDTARTYSDFDTPNWILGNTRSDRLASRVGYENAEGVAMIAFLLPGSVVMKQGDEIGMSNTYTIALDPCERSNVKNTESNIKSNTPFHWSGVANGGFTRADSDPWLSLGEYQGRINLEAQRNQGRSIYKLHKYLAELRQSSLFANGTFEVVVVNRDIVLCVRKLTQRQQAMLIMFNPTLKTGSLDMEALEDFHDEFTVLLVNEHSSRAMGDKISLSKLRLSQGEALVGIVMNKPCSGVKPVDRIVSKMSQAVQKVNDYLRISELFNK